MKKLVYFLIILPLAVMAIGSSERTLYTENISTKLDNQNITIEPSGTGEIRTTKDLVVGFGTNKQFDSIESFFRARSTGMSSPTTLTQNSGDNTLFDVGAVQGQIADFPNDTYYKIDFAGQTGITPLNGTSGISYVFIDNTGSIMQQSTEPTPEDRRQNIFIGRVITNASSVVSQTIVNPVVTENIANSLYDMFDAIGTFNDSGNLITPNGSNLNLNKSEGKIFDKGANYGTNREDPHRVTTSSCTTCSFFYNVQTGLGLTSTTAIVPSSYDNAGTVTAISGSNNRATNQRIYLFPSGNLTIQYGQNIYSTLAEAAQNVDNESFVVNPNFSGGVLIAVLSVRKGASDLSLDTDAIITYPNQFGGNAGTAGGISTLQDAYENSVDGIITLDGTRGAFKIYDQSGGSGAQELFKVSDNTGSTDYFEVFLNLVSVNVPLTVTGDYFRFPVVDTAGRTGSPSTGMSAWNTDEECLELYNGVEWFCVGTGSGGGSGLNFISDYSFENEELAPDSHPVGGTVDYATYVAGTDIYSEFNTKYYEVTWAGLSAEDVYLRDTFPRSGLDGKWGRLEFYVIATTTSNQTITVCLTVDDSSFAGDCDQEKTFVPDGTPQKVVFEFQYGSTSVEYRVFNDNYTGSAVLGVDEVVLGMANVTAIGQVNSSSYVGGLSVSVTNCRWESSSTSWAAFSADADCGGNYTTIGNVLAPSTNIPAVRIPNARTDGYYRIEVDSLFGSLDNTYNSYYTLSSDSAFDNQPVLNNVGTGSQYTNQLNGNFRFDSGGEKTIQILTQVSNASNTALVYGDAIIDRQFNINVWFYPDSESAIATQRTEICQVIAKSNDADNIAANTEDIPYKTVQKDNCNLWSNGGNTGANTNDQYTADKTGLISVDIRATTTSTSGMAFDVYEDGSFYWRCGNNPTGANEKNTSCKFEVTKNNTYTFRFTTAFTLSISDNHTIVITEAPDSLNAIGKFENINDTPICSVIYNDQNGETITITTEDIGWKTKIYDNCNAMSTEGNTGEGYFDTYTAQKSGIIDITFAVVPSVSNVFGIYRDGVRDELDFGRIAASTHDPQTTQIYVTEGEKITFRGLSADFNTTSGDVRRHFIMIRENPDLSAVVEQLANNPRSARDDQYSETEIEWGKWNGEQLYRRCFTVDSEITSTDTTYIDWGTGLSPKGITQYFANFWAIDGQADGGTGSNYYRIFYNSSTGYVGVDMTGTFTVGAGTSHCVNYTK